MFCNLTDYQFKNDLFKLKNVLQRIGSFFEFAGLLPVLLHKETRDVFYEASLKKEKSRLIWNLLAWISQHFATGLFGSTNKAQVDSITANSNQA